MAKEGFNANDVQTLLHAALVPCDSVQISVMSGKDNKNKFEIRAFFIPQHTRPTSIAVIANSDVTKDELPSIIEGLKQQYKP